MNPRPILVLPETLVGRIAAGEVVERPAAVIKELLENSLDAGARRIRVEIEGDLTGVLRVTDDGHGIRAADLPLAVERHATSKIVNPDDLDHIETLGFRGEGLGAIGAVSRLRVSSRIAGEDSGFEIVVDGGLPEPVVPVGRAVGTTIEVRDLFFNTPARLKYLKSTSAELRHIAQLVSAYALARPDVGMSLTVDGRSSVDVAPAEDLHARLQQILGRERVGRMIPVLHEGRDITLEGFVGAPEDARARAGHQIFLINGRWVTSQLLRTAVRQAYGDLIPPARHPEAVLLLTLPPETVDVNVHPTKREVRLARERELYPRLIRILRERVEARFPSLDLDRPGYGPTPPATAPSTGQQTLDWARAATVEPGGAGESSTARVVPFPSRVSDAPQESASGESAPAMASMWQLHETYIMAAIENGLLMVDQHAAHERVLYEQALRRLQGEQAPSQELLFPVTVDLAPDEFSILLEVHGVLEALGFHLERFGGTTVLVHAIPAGLREWRHGAILRDVLDHFADLPTQLDIQERIARSVACHGAVKAGQKLSLTEMNALIDQLFATEKPQGDPHGRPVFLRIELDDLHRRFGRSGG